LSLLKTSKYLLVANVILYSACDLIPSFTYKFI